MSDRVSAAKAFLDTTSWAGIEPVSMFGDASARRYFRVPGSPTAILMDAPPDAQQKTDMFLLVADALRDLGLRAPKVYASDLAAGFVLMEDFGDAIFVRVVTDMPARELPLYRAALDVLVTLDAADVPLYLPCYSAADMAGMISPAFDWYAAATGGAAPRPDVISSCLEQVLAPLPMTVFSLRDFHAENLIWMPDETGMKQVGLLDFQDAMVGPACYDLISLLFDARRDVSDGIIETIQAEFAARTRRDARAVVEQCATLGLQRNLRILGIFARLALQDGKTRYLDFLPRVWRYVEVCLREPHLTECADLILDTLTPPTPGVMRDLLSQCETNRAP